MIDYNSYWQFHRPESIAEVKQHSSVIYSYRVSSVRLNKIPQLRVKAQKKVLSPLASAKLPLLPYIYSPMNKTFVYPKPSLKRELLVKEDFRCGSPSKERWVEKHFSCYQKPNIRSKSIQGDYKKEPLQLRGSAINTCEISLQTFGQ